MTANCTEFTIIFHSFVICVVSEILLTKQLRNAIFKTYQCSFVSLDLQLNFDAFFCYDRDAYL